jgi:hypothetical protein
MQHAKSDAKPAAEAGRFFQTLAGFAIVALVVLGVGGTVYKLLAPGGWLAQLLGRSVEAGMAAVFGLAAVALLAWLSRDWVSERRRNRHSELFVYAFAAAGALYGIQFLVKGAF